MISLFGNKNEVSDTQRELEEYMKKRSQDNSGMNFNGYYSPDSFTGNTPQQGYAQSDSQAEYRNETERNAKANAVWKSEISFKGGVKNLASGIVITAVVSVIGLALAVFCAAINPIYGIMVFGAVIAVVGFFMSISDNVLKIGYGGLIIAIAGIVLTVGAASALTGFKTILPVLSTALFTILGACMIIIPCVRLKHKKRICTEKVLGEVIDIKKRRSRSNGSSSTVYCPVYKYKYLGMVYTHSSNTYTNVGVPKPGSVTEMRVNPNDPQQAYVVKDNGRSATVVMGALFMVISLFITAMIILTSN